MLRNSYLMGHQSWLKFHRFLWQLAPGSNRNPIIAKSNGLEMCSSKYSWWRALCGRCHRLAGTIYPPIPTHPVSVLITCPAWPGTGRQWRLPRFHCRLQIVWPNHLFWVKPVFVDGVVSHGEQEAILKRFFRDSGSLYLCICKYN